MNAVDITTKDPWYTGLMDLPTAGYTDGATDADIKKLQATLAAKTNLADQLGIWQDWVTQVSDPAFYANVKKITPAQQKEYATKAKTVYTDAFDKWMEQAKLPSSVQSILSDDPLTKLPSYLSGYLALDPKDPASVEAYKAQLKKDFGGLKDKNGNPVISDVLINQVASGKQDFSTLNDRVTQAVTSVANKQLGSAAGQISDITKTDAYQSLLSNPSALTSAYNSTVAGLNQDATTGAWTPKTTGIDTSPGGAGIDSLGYTNGTFGYTGGSGQLLTDGKVDPTKVKAVVDAYDTQKGTWHLPDTGTSGLTQTDTTPFGSYLQNMLVNYANKGDFYSPSYVNNLKQPEAPNLTNIKKPFEANPTSKDLLTLANNVGQLYDPNAKTSLSPYLVKTYQPSTTNAAGQAAKPGAPDTTNTKLPVVPKAGEPIVTGVTTGAGTGKVTTPPVKTAAELAAEKFAADKAAYMSSFTTGDYITPTTRNSLISSGQTSTDPKLAAQVDWSAQFEQTPEYKTAYGMTPAEIEKAKAEKAEAERQAGIKALAEKAEADRLAEINRLAAEKAEAERQAGLVALANQQASEKAAADKAAADKAAADRLASLGRNPDGGPSSLAPINPNTYGPQQVTLNPNTVVSSPSGINALSAQTVAPPPSGPQPINPSNGGPTSAIVAPITAAQRDLGPLNISNLGAVIGPQAMNSTAGGVASLVGPQVTVQPQTQPAVTYTYAPSSQQQLEDKAVNAGYQGDYTDTAAMNSFLNANNQSVAPAVTQQNAGAGTVLAPASTQTPAQIAATQQAIQAAEDASAATSAAAPQGGINSLGQQVINPGATQVLNSAGVPIAGRRKFGIA